MKCALVGGSWYFEDVLTLRTVSWAALAGLLSAPACSGSESKNGGGAATTPETAGPATGSPNGSEPGSGMTTPPQTGPVGTETLIGNNTDNGLDDGDPAAISPPESCAGTVMETETIVRMSPVTLYLVLDNSKSMREDPVGGITKWDQAVEAFTEFVHDPASEGVGVGIQYFHPAAPPEAMAEIEAIKADLIANPPANDSDKCILGPSGIALCGDRIEYKVDKCDGVVHSKSAVEVGRLPAVADAVIQSLKSITPDSNTPTVGALTGGVDFCVKFQQEHPGEKCAVVFVTDGQPNGCGLSLACTPGFTPNERGDCVDPKAEGVLSPIVQTAHDTHDVVTYTVGMAGVIEDGFDLLDKLAILGGTDCTLDVAGKEACNVTETGSQGLLEALSKIRDAVVQTIEVPCVWAVPPPPDGKRLDPSLVNVGLSINQQKVELGQVAVAADCQSVENGWYYNVPSNPTEILSCPQTCDIVEQNSTDVRVSLEFGCATKRAVLK